MEWEGKEKNGWSIAKRKCLMYSKIGRVSKEINLVVNNLYTFYTTYLYVFYTVLTISICPLRYACSKG